MDAVLALLVGLMRRARLVFVGCYLVIAAGFLLADPRSGWTWFIIAAGACLCLLFWALVAFWSHVFTAGRERERGDGADHG